MHITTRHYCDNCHKEIERSGSREYKQLYEMFVIERRLCIPCITKHDFKVKG
jgi:hypothetical protein